MKNINIPGTGAHPGWHHISQDTEWADEPRLFTMGGPLDAPSALPAGGCFGLTQHTLLCGSALRIGAPNKPLQLHVEREA